MSSGADAPNRREVAHRLFAAEFDDASFSYSESDEERAPNYVVTPTGARVNRLFAVGVLTETERVNDDVLRARIADPTGAFVTYAGQYQPDAAAFLDRTESPAFVALTGKARTFEPDDSDRVFTSVRPESANAVDADTRDRWVVSTAEATLRRVAVFREALKLDARGDALREALLDRGVDEALAAGIPLAVERYGTTPAYLEAVRKLAVEALELVAGDRETVGSLDVAPDEGGTVEVGSVPTAGGTPTASESTGGSVTDSTGAGSEPSPSAASATDAGGTPTGSSSDSDSSSADPTSGADSATPDESTGETASGAGSASQPTAEAPGDGTDATTPESATSEPAGSSGDPGDLEEGSGSADATDTGEELGDFDVEPSGENEPGTSSEPSESAEAEPTAAAEPSAASESPSASAGAESGSESEPDTADDEMYELDEEERRAVEEEYGTAFESGADVGEPGEAGIDVPSADELSEEAASEVASESPDVVESTGADETAEAEPTPTPDSTVGADATAEVDATAETEPAAEPDSGAMVADTAAATEADVGPPESDTAGEADPDVGDASAEADGTPDASDVDLESAAVEAMEELDGGDGAEREAVVAAVVDEYGADPEAVADAIESALMGGRCYEPTEDRLKAI